LRPWSHVLRRRRERRFGLRLLDLAILLLVNIIFILIIHHLVGPL
jgi:hypothetical protein